MYSKVVSGCLAVVAVLGLAACGSSKSTSGKNTVDIYSSLPLQGASTAQTDPMVNGMKLALEEAGGKAGQWTINYTSLDDSTAAAGKWDPARCAANARKVAQDAKAVYYMGEFNSGCSEVSIPILNQAGVAQVSPANTYVGLTTNLPGSAPGEPQKYYPTGKRTYLRIVPLDSIQARGRPGGDEGSGLHEASQWPTTRRRTEPGWPTLIELEKGYYGVRCRATRHRPDCSQLPLLCSHDQGPGRRLLLVCGHRLQRCGADHQGRQRGAAQRPRSSAATACAQYLHKPEHGRRAREHRPADRVYGGHAGSGRLSGRQDVPCRLQGEVRRLKSRSVCDLWL